MKKMFNPFARISRQSFAVMIVLQVATTLLLWQTASNGLIPAPGKEAGLQQQPFLAFIAG